jgi:hypothetical protein
VPGNAWAYLVGAGEGRRCCAAAADPGEADGRDDRRPDPPLPAANDLPHVTITRR